MFPMHRSSTPWKHKKTLWFLGTNGLNKIPQGKTKKDAPVVTYTLQNQQSQCYLIITHFIIFKYHDFSQKR